MSSYWRTQKICFGQTGFRNLISGINQLIRFAKKVACITAEAEKIKMELNGSFPEVFSAGLGKCTKIKAKFELKENTRPIFRKKRNVPFATTEEIDKELDRLVNIGILSKVEFSEWAAPTVYVRKKCKEIRDWTLHSRITTIHSPTQKMFLIN